VEGIDGFIIAVEVDISYGLPVFNIVGLPEISVKESKDRVKTAIKNSGYTFPMERIVVNLAPADVKKEGTGTSPPGKHQRARRNLPREIPADASSECCGAGDVGARIHARRWRGQRRRSSTSS